MTTPRLALRRSATLLGLMLAFGTLSTSVVQAQVPQSILDEDPAVLTAPPIPDRIEGINRFMFKFNDKAYRYVLKPFSRGYKAVLPSALRRGIGNVFRNLAFPTRFVGNVLEGHPRGALVETERFIVNTTVGLGGIMAVADRDPKLRVAESDLGQAVGTWGVGHGTYLVLPILGPSSVRDGLGDLVSGLYLAPVQYIKGWQYRTAATGINSANPMPELMDSYDNLSNGAFDPYIALRDAFSARRAQQIRAQKEVEKNLKAATQSSP